jgi:predicted RNA binding protein YcfA (HicA-like mRNA interferase family)
MSGLHNLKPDRVVKAFMRAGWHLERQTASHVILSKDAFPLIISIPVHKGKPIKQGLLRNLINITGLTVDDFLRLYK